MSTSCPGDDDGPDADKINYALNAMMGNMQERIVMEEERNNRARHQENELRKRMIELDGDFKEI